MHWFLIILLSMAFQNKQSESPLTCHIAVEQATLKAQNKVVFILTNHSSKPLNVAKAISTCESVWFRIRLEDSEGNVLLSGLEDVFITTRSLPALETQMLQPNESIDCTIHLNIKPAYGIEKAFSLSLNRGNALISETFSSLILKEGTYKLSVIYRFSPKTEKGGADYYQRFAKKEKLWTGIVQSLPVSIQVTSDVSED